MAHPWTADRGGCQPRTPGAGHGLDNEAPPLGHLGPQLAPLAQMAMVVVLGMALGFSALWLVARALCLRTPEAGAPPQQCRATSMPAWPVPWREPCPTRGSGLSVSTRFGVHPACRPEARAATAASQTAPLTAGDGLPPLEAVQAGGSPALRRVPQAARHSWCKALTRALAAVLHSGSESAWRELLMLPQTVLDAPPRGGKKHKKALVAHTLDRIQRWHEGERAALWHRRHVPKRAHKHKPRTNEQRRDSAVALAREG